ncbi:MAG: glycosyltransferase family 39 protein [Bacteroidota bacterium]
MDYFPGILFLIFSATILFFIFRKYKLRDYKQALYAIILLGLILRIYTASDPFLHKWDERYHALVAKNMLEDPFVPKLYKEAVLDYNYKDWAANHIWVHKQPVPLWNIMFSFKVFGVNEFALRLPSLLLSSLMILLVFLIGKRLYSEKIGIISAFFSSVNGLIIELGAGRVATDHIDIHFAVYICLSVYFLIKYHDGDGFIYNLLAALAISLAILSKWLPALIVLPIWLLLAKRQKRTIRESWVAFFIFCILTTLIILPWQIYILDKFPLEASWEFEYNRKHITEVLGEHSGGIGYYFTKLRIQYGELIYLPLLGLIWAIWKKRAKRIDLIILFIWLIIPFIFFTIVKTKMKAYLLFTSPAIFLIIALFINFLDYWKRKIRRRDILMLIQVLFILLALRYCFERVKPFQKVNQEVLNRISRYRTYPPNTVVFNENYYVEAMFYSECIAVYPFKPSQEQVEIVKAKGYQVIVEPD